MHAQPQRGAVVGPGGQIGRVLTKSTASNPFSSIDTEHLSEETPEGLFLSFKHIQTVLQNTYPDSRGHLYFSSIHFEKPLAVRAHRHSARENASCPQQPAPQDCILQTHSKLHSLC